nr:MAG TPA: hypothetical protein [Caudoviricetes sp.]
MITDEQGREWLLQKMYDAGYRDIDVHYGKAKFFIEKDGYVDTTVCVPASVLGLNEEVGYIDIAERLGIVDWSKVEVDTPVLVSLDDKSWVCRYFADFKNGIVYTWRNGATSWSVPRGEYKDAWSFAKLAEV